MAKNSIYLILHFFLFVRFCFFFSLLFVCWPYFVPAKNKSKFKYLHAAVGYFLFASLYYYYYILFNVNFFFTVPQRAGVRKYVVWCLICGGLSCLLGFMFLGVYFLVRSYTSTVGYFETVPTFVPATLVS